MAGLDFGALTEDYRRDQHAAADAANRNYVVGVKGHWLALVRGRNVDNDTNSTPARKVLELYEVNRRRLSQPEHQGKIMTNSEIAALAKRVSLGGVWWHDDDNRIHRVRTVQVGGAASQDAAKIAAPAALLMDDRSIALEAAKVSEFVTLQPAVTPGT